MFDRLSALTDQFQSNYALIAVGVCMLSSLTAVRLLARGVVARGEARPIWLILSGISIGFGAWSTHFMTMLAYDPGVATGHGPVGMVMALILAVLMMTAAIYTTANVTGWIRVFAGGIIFVLGVAAMHYTSMNDFRINGTIFYNKPYMIAGLVVATAFAVGSFAVFGDAKSTLKQALSGIFLGLSITTFHVLNMASMHVVSKPGAAGGALVISDAAIAVSIGAMTLVVIATGLGAALVDAQSSEKAVERLRRLANGTFEGIVITTHGRIVDANNSFLNLVRASREELLGKPVENSILERGYSQTGNDDALLSPYDRSEAFPVEVRSRSLSEDKSETVYAIRDLREQRRAEEEIRHLAQHDATTQLLNRNAFMNRLDMMLERASTEQEPAALLFIDLDLFKNVNDVHGHRAGDHVIMEVASRLRTVMKGTTIIGRVGGDEFVVAIYGGAQPKDAAQCAHNIIEELQREIIFEEQQIEISASVGVSLFPDDTDSASDLVAFADMALYRAKKSGRNTACFFSHEMDESVRDRRRLARDLKKGIDNNELLLSYQPLASMTDGRVVGFEALVRWQHPVRGLMQPDDFILVAEENGLIIALGNWVLERACSEAAQWERPFRVAINISALHLQDNSLVARVHETLVNTGLSPSRLEIEITESALFLDQARALSNLRRLKALGVRIAMDDFGTGYSSLSTLNAFPFDRIKIDRSFVEDVGRTEQSRMIVRAIVGLGHSLGVPITAEGVETEEQMEFLRSEGCDQAQGFLIGRPEAIGLHSEHFSPATSTPSAVAKAS